VGAVLHRVVGGVKAQRRSNAVPCGDYFGLAMNYSAVANRAVNQVLPGDSHAPPCLSVIQKNKNCISAAVLTSVRPSEGCDERQAPRERRTAPHWPTRHTAGGSARPDL